MRTFLVTGASAGIGEAIALGCAKVPSAAVIIVGRNEQRCKAARDRVAAASHNPNICTPHKSFCLCSIYFCLFSIVWWRVRPRVMVFWRARALARPPTWFCFLSPLLVIVAFVIAYEVVDLSSYRSVSDFTKKFRESGKALHVLVNNAGWPHSLLPFFMQLTRCWLVASCPVNKELSVDGLEMQFATNVMGYFWLTNGLVDVLQVPAPLLVLGCVKCSSSQFCVFIVILFTMFVSF